MADVCGWRRSQERVHTQKDFGVKVKGQNAKICSVSDVSVQEFAQDARVRVRRRLENVGA